MKRILITGAGGFIGSHLAANLAATEKYWIRGVDIKYPEYIPTKIFDDFQLLDLRHYENALLAMVGVNQVYALAADEVLRNNSLIDINTLEAAKQNYIERYFYASSACVYPEYLQQVSGATPLSEESVYPAKPPDAFGWQKLFTEILCKHYAEQYKMEIRIGRFHNIFGPQDIWDGGREKVPAALCRKIALAKLNNQDFIEVWGDGEQTRSFCYIDDCVTGMQLLMGSDYRDPLNLGQDRMVTINELANMIMEIAGIKVEIKHIEGPQGVRGRNSDNTKLKRALMWTPHVSLEEGLEKTYKWIYEKISEKSSDNTLTNS